MRNLYIHLQNKNTKFGCIEALSEQGVEKYLVKAIMLTKWTKLLSSSHYDCDNIENYLQRLGGGSSQSLHLILTQYPD